MKKSKSQKELLDKNDLTGLWYWRLEEKKEAWELIKEYASIFTMNNMDLYQTSLVKHNIRLTDNTPFK